MNNKHLDFLKKYHETSKSKQPKLLNKYLMELTKKGECDDFLDNYSIGLVVKDFSLEYANSATNS